MVELEINTMEQQVPPVEREKPLEINEVILGALFDLEENLEDIVIIDFLFIKDVCDSFKGVSTVRRLMDVNGMAENLVKCFEMLDEEKKSTKQSMSFLRIISSLFSNAEADYYDIFNGVKNE